MDEKRRRFEARVLPHLDAAYAFARWLCRSPTAAEDVVQEAMLRAFRGFDAVRGSNVKAWLLTIVRNCHLTAVQQQQRHLMVPLPEDDDAEDTAAMTAPASDPETAAMHRDAERSLARLIATLPEEYREVLVLREIEDLGYREIAAVIDVPIGTVMSRLARARSALRSRWQKETAAELHAVR